MAELSITLEYLLDKLGIYEFGKLVKNWLICHANDSEEQIRLTVESLKHKINKNSGGNTLVDYLYDYISLPNCKLWMKYLLDNGASCRFLIYADIKISDFNEEFIDDYIEYLKYSGSNTITDGILQGPIVFLDNTILYLFEYKNINIYKLVDILNFILSINIEDFTNEYIKEYDLNEQDLYERKIKFLLDVLNMFNRKLIQAKNINKNQELKIKELEDTILTLQLRPPELGGDLYNEAKSEFSTTLEKI